MVTAKKGCDMINRHAEVGRPKSLQEWLGMLRAKLYADGQMSGPSAYGLARAATKIDRRRRLAVGIEMATPVAALGVQLAVGVAHAMRPLPPRP
jgi:hypothetical protein